MTDPGATQSTGDHVRVAFPAPAPASAAPATTLAGVALVTLDRPAALNALSFDLLDELAAPSRPSTPIRAAGRSS